MVCGLLAPGDTGGDWKESKSTRLYLPDLTLRASSLSSNAAPTLDLQEPASTSSGLWCCSADAAHCCFQTISLHEWFDSQPVPDIFLGLFKTAQDVMQ